MGGIAGTSKPCREASDLALAVALEVDDGVNGGALQTVGSDELGRDCDLPRPLCHGTDARVALQSLSLTPMSEIRS